MAGRLLPDTNAFIALMRGDAQVVDTFNQAEEVVLAAIVLGELIYGALNSRSAEANLANLEKLRAKCRFVPVDEVVVREYGRIRLALKKKGRPIPENDVWIAATASAVDATVLTDDAHFDEVEGIDLKKLS